MGILTPSFMTHAIDFDFGVAQRLTTAIKPPSYVEERRFSAA
jgi:hypothetical protein